MSRPFLTRTLTGALLTLSLGACTAPQVGSPCPIPEKADAKTRQEAVQKCFGLIAGNSNDFRVKKDVDILFMIDNSPSMSPKQAALAKNIPKFIEKIESFGVNYHVGIITSDVGTTVSDGATWGAGSESSCDSFSGDDGRLQDLTCDKRNTVSPQEVSNKMGAEIIRLWCASTDYSGDLAIDDKILASMPSSAWLSSETLAAASKVRWKRCGAP